jgi:Flp pilus assembly protein TadD
MTLALYHLASISLTQGNVDEAISMLEKVIESTPDFRSGFEALGRALIRKRDFARAVVVLERAVRLDPNWPNAHVLLGRAYAGAGRQEAAKKEFATAQELVDAERKRLEQKVRTPSRSPTPP